jgi:hypothetical protein
MSKQIHVFEAVRATRLTGTLTAPLVHPRPTVPLVNTREPASTASRTRGTLSDCNVRRIAVVPAGSSSPP